MFDLYPAVLGAIAIGLVFAFMGLRMYKSMAAALVSVPAPAAMDSKQSASARNRSAQSPVPKAAQHCKYPASTPAKRLSANRTPGGKKSPASGKASKRVSNELASLSFASPGPAMSGSSKRRSRGD